MAILGLPGPVELLQLADQGQRAAREAIALVPRLVALVGQVERIVGRVETVVGQVETVVAEVDRTQRRAAGVVDETGGLISRFAPVLDQLEPVLRRLAETTSPEEVTAVVALVDRLPELVGVLETDIMPILGTMSTVAPDLRELLDASRELNEIITQIPGLRRKRDDDD